MIQAMSANKPPHILDMTTACLCCLTAESGTISVYAHDLKPPHMKILDKIRHSTGLQLDSSTYVEMTSWPDKICQECHIELTVAYRFHEKIATVEKLFMSPTGLPMDKQLEEQERLEQQRQNHLKQQHMQLRQQLERHHLRLPATLKIKRLEMMEAGVSVSSTRATATESSYFQDLVEKEKEAEEEKLADDEESETETETEAVPSATTTLLPDEGMVLSLDDLDDDETEPLKMGGEPLTDEELEEEEQEEDEDDDKLLSLSPWDNDQTPEHLYEIETPIMEEELPPPPTMPPPPPPPLPPPPAQATSNKLRKRTYRRVSPIVKQESGKVADSSDRFQPETMVMAAASSKRRQSERSPKICDVCGNTYKYQHALNAHMRRHNNDRPYPCEVCQKAFISNVELRRHMRVHTGQKPYGCKYCERRFSDFGSSKKHERIHTGERPYVCEVCHKGFAYAHVLSVHRRTHTGKKQFQCTKCDKGFTKKSYLSAHMEQQHRGSGGSGELSGEGEGEGDEMESGFNAGAGQQRLRLPGRSKQDTPFSLDSVVLGEQNKVLEECIVTNDFMFNEEDEDDDGGGPDVDENEQEAEEAAEDAVHHHESITYPPQPDFDDDVVDGYHQTVVRSSDPIKELVGDLLDTEEFDDESKYLID